MESLEKYKDFLELNTHIGQDYRFFNSTPKGRYHTFKKAFEIFINNDGKVIVELGTIRSYVHGGIEGCNTDNMSLWTPHHPERWDWGAGCFSRVAAEIFQNKSVKIYTVDISSTHIERCRVITEEYSSMFCYYIMNSLDFLRSINHKVDLLYLDTGDMTPIEPTATHQLEEAKVIVERDLILKGGLLLIDDVKNTTPMKFGETSLMGKAKYSIPYLLSHGYTMLMDEYQVLLEKN